MELEVGNMEGIGAILIIGVCARGLVLNTNLLLVR
jgi:hypothetical protein